ncbi:MAG TPA: response regulator transcription factor [Thermoanaerobaculia bacterium]|nr:response regulator transcription factor [Thermoanaerobaculia bacterium]
MNRTILVIEDNEELAFGLQTNLEIEGYEVHVAADGNSGLEAARTLHPHLLVLDLMLPGPDGFRVLRSIREEGLHVPVLILTARAEEVDKVRGLKLGADDYVTKPFGILEFLARVEALLRRSAAPLARRTSRFGEIVIDRDARAVFRRGERVSLKPKEFDLLVALFDRDERAVSRLELVRDVWGYSDSVITRTVDTHVAELRRKLEDDPRIPAHILTVQRYGYRLVREADDKLLTDR